MHALALILRAGFAAAAIGLAAAPAVQAQGQPPGAGMQPCWPGDPSCRHGQGQQDQGRMKAPVLKTGPGQPRAGQPVPTRGQPAVAAPVATPQVDLGPPGRLAPGQLPPGQSARPEFRPADPPQPAVPGQSRNGSTARPEFATPATVGPQTGQIARDSMPYEPPRGSTLAEPPRGQEYRLMGDRLVLVDSATLAVVSVLGLVSALTR